MSLIFEKDEYMYLFTILHLNWHQHFLNRQFFICCSPTHYVGHAKNQIVIEVFEYLVNMLQHQINNNLVVIKNW